MIGSHKWQGGQCEKLSRWVPKAPHAPPSSDAGAHKLAGISGVQPASDLSLLFTGGKEKIIQQSQHFFLAVFWCLMCIIYIHIFRSFNGQIFIVVQQYQELPQTKSLLISCNSVLLPEVTKVQTTFATQVLTFTKCLHGDFLARWWGPTHLPSVSPSFLTPFYENFHYIYRDHICHKHHKQRLCKIIISRVKVHFVAVFGPIVSKFEGYRKKIQTC